MRRFTAPAVRAYCAVATVAALLLVAGCSGDDDDTSGDSLQVVANPKAAKAAHSPETGGDADGRTIDVSGDISAVHADTDSNTLAAATTDPAEVALYRLDDLTGDPVATVDIPGKATDFTFSDDTLLASVPSADSVVRIPLRHPSDSSRTHVRGAPTATARHGSRTLTGLRDSKSVLVHQDGGGSKSVNGGLYSVDDVVVAGGTAFVLDRLRTTLFRVNVGKGEFQEGLRAGQGATNAATDSHGRVLVTDTRGGSLLAFGTDPLLMRQRYPVSGGIYGISYDTKRDLAWVTLTKKNELVGFDMTGGAPKEEYRYSTVRQPNSVATDERNGRVIVGSAAGEGMQVITP